MRDLGPAHSTLLHRLQGSPLSVVLPVIFVAERFNHLFEMTNCEQRSIPILVNSVILQRLRYLKYGVKRHSRHLLYLKNFVLEIAECGRKITVASCGQTSDIGQVGTARSCSHIVPQRLNACDNAVLYSFKADDVLMASCSKLYVPRHPRYWDAAYGVMIADYDPGKSIKSIMKLKGRSSHFESGWIKRLPLPFWDF